MRDGDARLSGYLNPAYAASLAEFGTPHYLPRSGGWLLIRQIPGTAYRDAMGCYPFFSCMDWSRLAADLDALSRDLVSVTLVPDPFGDYDRALLEHCFDHVTYFKDHFVADLSRPLDEIVKRSHRETVRRALNKVEVRLCLSPHEHLDQWMNLFAVLIKRHNITGIRAFSRGAFARQLTIPGAVMFEARARGATVGLDLWYIQGDVAYGHLAAFNMLGYELRASYATKWHMLRHFVGKVRWVHFGGGSGSGEMASDGLSRFKQGWSTGTRPVHVCGRILQPDAYAALSRSVASESKYFPAYRTGEFA